MLPNKIISVSDSIIWKLPYILEVIKQGEISTINLYSAVSQRFTDVSEFILCLDALYLLDRFEYNEKHEVIKYVDKNLF